MLTEASGVRPGLIMAMTFRESTWRRDAVGKLGELGMMQYQPRLLASDADAAVYLMSCITTCGSEAGGVALYGRGHGCKPSLGSLRRVRLADKIDLLIEQEKLKAKGVKSEVSVQAD